MIEVRRMDERQAAVDETGYSHGDWERLDPDLPDDPDFFGVSPEPRRERLGVEGRASKGAARIASMNARYTMKEDGFIVS